MKKTDLKKTTDLVLWFLFCFILGTGLMIHYRLVPGGAGLTFLGMSRHGWGNLHFWAACLFITALGVHLYLNFNMIRTLIADKSNRKCIIIFGIGILIILFFLLFPVFHGQSGYGKSRNYHHGKQAGSLFR